MIEAAKFVSKKIPLLAFRIKKINDAYYNDLNQEIQKTHFC